MKALLIKEFRENLRWLPVGIFVFAVVTWYVLPNQNNPFVSVDSNLTGLIALTGPMLALALGALQSALDLRNGARGYLECRGVTSSEIVLAKMISGFVIYALALGLPIAALALYLNCVGLTYYPVRPLQAMPGLLVGFAGFAFHPAAIIVLARPASWWGTRLLPLTSALLVATLAISFLLSFSSLHAWAAIGISIVGIALHGWGAVDAWTKLSLNPAGGLACRSGWGIITVLFLNASIATVIVPCFLANFYNNWTTHSENPTKWSGTFQIDSATGEPYGVNLPKKNEVDFERQYNAVDSKKEVFGFKLVKGKPLTIEEPPRIDVPLRDFSWEYSWSKGYAKFFFVSSRAGVFDIGHGNLLLYERLRYPYSSYRLKSVISRDGVQSTDHVQGKPFAKLVDASFDVFARMGFGPAFADENGVYQFSISEQDQPEFRTVLDQKIDEIQLVHVEDKAAPRMLIFANSQLLDYRLLDETGSDQWWDSPSVSRQGSIEFRQLPKLHASLVRRVDTPKKLDLENINGIAIYDAGYVIRGFSNIEAQRFITVTNESAVQDITYSIHPPRKIFEVEPSSFVFGFMPPAFCAVVLSAVEIDAAIHDHDSMLRTNLQRDPGSAIVFVVVGIFGIIISMILSARLMRIRDVTRRVRFWWLVCCIPCGIATPLAILAIYPRLIYERCARCEARRRIDLEHCEACHTAWEPQDPQGIEITDAPQLETTLQVT